MNTFSATEFLSKLITPWVAVPTVPIHYVSENPRWSFYWDAKYLSAGLRESAGVESEIVQKPWRLRSTIVHFGDRRCLPDGPIQRLAENNTLFLSWCHRQRDDPDASRQCENLCQQQELVQQIVTPCSQSYNDMLAFGIEAERMVTIPLGIDLERFRPCRVDRKLALRRELGIPRDALCIGSFQKDGVGWGDGDTPALAKGPDVFLETVRHLAKRFENLFVILTGPARGYVKNGLRKIGVSFLHRHLDKYWDLIHYYQALDLYVIASRCEGGPKALLECWAVGVPLVSTRMGMPADLVKDGINGGLADVEDAGALAERAAELCLDSAFRHDCRQQALEDARAYSWSAIAQQYYRVYEPHLRHMRAA